MSVLEDIYTQLAALDVTVDGVTPRVRGLDELKKTLNSADAPVRMLRRATGDESSLQDAAFIALGKMQRGTWLINDTLYWKPAAQGAGIEDHALTLARYEAAYMEVIRQNRALGLAQVHISGLAMTPGVYAWPPGGSVFYYGVQCILTVDEWVTGA